MFAKKSINELVEATDSIKTYIWTTWYICFKNKE